MNAIIGLFLRHVLTALGLQAFLTPEESNKVGGAIAIALGLLWSAYQKKKSGAIAAKQSDPAAASVASTITKT